MLHPTDSLREQSGVHASREMISAPPHEGFNAVAHHGTSPASINEDEISCLRADAEPAPCSVESEELDVGEVVKYFCSMTRAEKESWAARIIQRSCRWSRKRIRIRAAWEVKLQEKIRESKRRAVAGVRAGASATEKAEIFKELQAISRRNEGRSC